MRRNWDRVRERERMRRQGTESVQAETPFMRLLLQPRKPAPPRPSKAELRAEAALLVEKFMKNQR